MAAVRGAAIAALLMLLANLPSLAQPGYPERGIRLLYGFPAGADLVARLLADKLTDAFGKPVIVENISGAAGNIAADRTAKATPDGYAVGLLTGANITINVSLYSKLPFDPVKDLMPVTLVFGYPNVLVVNNEVPATSVAELVALARAKPGTLSFGHSGLGTTQHLAGELLKTRAGIDIQDVPYRGPPQIVADLLSGRIEMSFLSTGGTFGIMKERKVRPLAVTSRERAPFFPELPTMMEVGFPGFAMTVWFGLFAPAGTPEPIIARLHRETTRIMSDDEVRKRLVEVGLVPLGNSPAEFAELIRTETPYWAALIKELRIKRID
jgi:tripartite-type tricarboxylate transporter receptor subunit TctC